MKKIIKNTFFMIYIVIAIFITICLLSYNEYKISEFGDNSLVLVTNNDLNPDYNMGDLLIVNSGNKNKINIGDKIFFYNKNDENRIEVDYAEVLNKEIITSREITFTVANNHQISSRYVIGASKNTASIPKLGMILSILESKWGYLFAVVFPSLIAFLYELTIVFNDYRELRKEEKKEDKKEKEKAKDKKQKEEDIEEKKNKKEEDLKETIEESAEEQEINEEKQESVEEQEANEEEQEFAEEQEANEEEEESNEEKEIKEEK